MVDNQSLPILLLLFAAAAAAVWFAGIHLSNTTDILARKFGLGEALGGLLVLAIVTNLPEIAITISASMSGKVELAIGNILGGIALQTVVLVVLDVVGVGKKSTLSSQTNSLTPVLEGCLVVAMLTVVVMGHQLPATLMVARLTPTGVTLVAVWIMGIYLISHARRGLPWKAVGGPASATSKDATKNPAGSATGKNVLIFSVAALATLVGGYVLEETGNGIADKIGMTGVLFGATVLAAATALPELSTGLASVKLKDYSMAVSDIFGGNAFLPVLFPLAVLVSGKAVVPLAHKTDIYLSGLGMLLTVAYMCGFLFRSSRQMARMGIDSLLVIVLYLVGLAGLFFISH